jgi:hypothetical protein
MACYIYYTANVSYEKDSWTAQKQQTIDQLILNSKVGEGSIFSPLTHAPKIRCYKPAGLFVYIHLSKFSTIRRLSPITCERAAKLDLCLALTAFSSEGSFIGVS